MSAFAVVYERSNTGVDPVVLERVMDRLKHRGPDGSDVIMAGHVALGHWHFWTTPEEMEERQPLKLEGLPFKLVFDGRLDNRSELFAKMNIHPLESKNISDAALVLRAYDRWGADCFEDFIGEYALVIFDEHREELICARDALGDRTLFYSFRGSRVAIASEPWAVVGADGSAAELNETAVAHYFALKATQDGQTLFKNIYELLPSHAMRINASGQHSWRYWRPDPSARIRGKSDKEYAEQFLSLLEESVRCRMRSITPVGVLMSGGLDSGSVACLAARMMAPKQLTTISYVFDELTDCDERKYIETIKNRWDIRSIQIPCDDAWPYKDWDNWPRNPNQPEGNPYRLLKERAYKRAKQEGVSVLLTGGFGDHLYSAGTDWLADLISERRFLEAGQELGLHVRYAGFRWILQAGFLQRVARRLLDTIPGGTHMRRKRSAATWLTSFTTDHLFKEKCRADSVSEQYGNPLSLIASQSSSGEIHNASRNALDLRHPYRDRRLVEFVLSLPAYQLYYRGLYKYVLRAAMLEILPEAIRTRPQPTSMVSLFSRGIDREKNILQYYFHNHAAEWPKYINADWILKQWNIAVTPDQDGPHALIPWMCISYESWYKTYNFSKLSFGDN